MSAQYKYRDNVYSLVTTDYPMDRIVSLYHRLDRRLRNLSRGPNALVSAVIAFLVWVGLESLFGTVSVSTFIMGEGAGLGIGIVFYWFDEPSSNGLSD